MNQKTAIAVFISILIIVSGVIVYAFLETENNESTTVIRIGSEVSETDNAEIVSSTSVLLTTTKVTATKAVTAQVSAEAVTEPLMININTAQKEDFMRLSGIGDAIADEIISFRTENGGFNNIEELMCVSGIGDVKFSQIKEFVFVENPFYPQPETENTTDIIFEDIPDEEITEPVEETHEITLADIAPVNINTADIDGLMLLPYVDEETAERIIALREEISVFSNVYEIMLVEGLTKSQCSEIIEYITVD